MTDYRLDQAAKYAKTHEWVRVEDGIAVVGISDAAQDQLSDVVYIELPEVGAVVEAGIEVAVVESVKAASDIYAPLSGEVIAANGELEDSPELVNSSPYGDGWLFKMIPSDSSQLDGLLDAEAYAAEQDD